MQTQQSAVYNTLCHKFPRLKQWGQSIQDCMVSGHGGIRLQHRLSAQRLADGINMWPNAVGTFNRPSAVFRYTNSLIRFPLNS